MAKNYRKEIFGRKLIFFTTFEFLAGNYELAALGENAVTVIIGIYFDFFFVKVQKKYLGSKSGQTFLSTTKNESSHNNL